MCACRGGMMPPGGPPGQGYGHVGAYGMELGKAAAAAGYAAERLRPEEAQRSYLLHQQVCSILICLSHCAPRPCLPLLADDVNDQLLVSRFRAHFAHTGMACGA